MRVWGPLPPAGSRGSAPGLLPHRIAPIHIAYLVHDLADPAVDRRLRMLASADRLVLLGFRRAGASVAALRGHPVTELGRTRDASFLHRIGAVARALLTARRWRPALAGADLLIARQLEMLLLAVLTRPRHAAIVYECLDIHRLMLHPGLPGRALRALERALLRRCSHLIVSSPAFLTAHFARQAPHPPPLLLENKVLHSDLDPALWSALHTGGRPGPAPGPLWRIGWFGVIRCARSLRLLADLATALPGLVEIVIRGRPSPTAVPEFAAILAATPGLRFEGPYDRARDLPAIYGQVHFAWAIDWFEAGGNSEWLLPNRLYESTLFGCVPIALAHVETGRWLARHRCGLLLGADPATELHAALRAHTPAGYRAARAAVAALPLDALADDRAACAQVVATLCAHGAPR